MKMRVFIQARMSSRRFPGKVLAPFRGRPILSHLIDRVARAVPRDRIVVATSTDPSDDPVAAYAATMSAKVFRGPLDNVFQRFQLCLRVYPCEWFFRVCADSPVYDPDVLRKMIPFVRRPGVDLVTNIFPRSFPKGNSAELIRTGTFRKLAGRKLSPEQKDHATKYFYDNPGLFRIVNLSSGDRRFARKRLVVDTVEDLRRLEAAAGRRTRRGP